VRFFGVVVLWCNLGVVLVRRCGVKVLVRVLVLLFLVGGCSAPPGPGRGRGVILLVDWRQGLMPMAALYDPPDFVLYGDGRAVVREERDSGVMKLVEYRLTPGRVSALFDEAVDAGLFSNQDYSLDVQVADGGSLVVMLRTVEREHLVKVGLPNPEEFGVRGDVAAFAESLQPSRWEDGDFSRPPTPYRPGRVAVTYDVVTTGAGEGGVPRVWPLTETESIQPRCVVLTGAAAAQAQVVGETVSQATLWRHGSTEFHAWVRPLLPDEADCRATEMRYLE